MPKKTIQRTDGIGARLKEERLRLGYSQTAFGEYCGVKKVAMFTYERGDRHPDTVFLAAADRIGVDILYVVTGRRSFGVQPSVLAADFKKRVAVAIGEAVKKALSEVVHD